MRSPTRVTLHLPQDWTDALAALTAARRVLVLGATDMGKSSFIRALLASRDEPMRLIDLDPGQKMMGPPCTASCGCRDRLERFIFLGSTSAGSFRQLTQAGTVLAEGAEPFVVNTGGYVQGPGARLQAMTAAALAPDAIVVIGPAPSLEPLLANTPALRLERSHEARRKSPSARAQIRQAAFAEALTGAERASFGPDEVNWEPGPPLPWPTEERPVCALADASGEDMTIGILEQELTVWSRPPPRQVRTIRLGKMWAGPSANGWLLQERLSPAWMES